jgi:hypothetical protein
MLKTFLKSQVPKLQEDLNIILEDILNEVANEKELNPFELTLTLSKKDERAIGQVYNKDQSCLHQLDAGALIEDLFKKQLSLIPEFFKKKILAKLGGENVNEMVLGMLKEESILVRFNRAYLLEYFQVNVEGVHPISMDDFFDNLEF